MNSAGPAVVSVSVTGGFAPSGAVNVYTLAEQVPDGQVPNKEAGNTPADPLYISPQKGMLEWPAGQPALNVTLPPFSFTILELFAS